MLKLLSRMIILMVACVPFTQADESYDLGPGDTISISVFGQPELSIEATLDDSGLIYFPFIEEITAVGLSTNGLSNTIRDKLRDGYLVNPQVFVNIVTFRQFYVLGDVKRPGGYAYQPDITVNEAIGLAGGMNSNGLFDLSIEPESIIVYRDGDSDNKINGTLNTILKAGDTIAVKQGKAQFFILGDVNRPGNYAYQEAITANDAIALAGGLQKSAVVEAIIVYKSDDRSTQKTVDASYLVQRGDTIEVKQGLLQYFISGDILRPGSYPFQSGMTIQQALSQAGGVKNEDGQSQFFVYAKGDSSNKTPVTNAYIIVQGDTVVIEQATAQFYILGEVNRPGVYTFQPGMTIMEAIAVAGGLTAKTPYTQSQVLKRISVFQMNDRSQSNMADVSSSIQLGDTIVIGKGMNQ